MSAPAGGSGSAGLQARLPQFVTILAAGAVDPHYTMITSPDTDFPGPDAIVVNDAWPIQSGVWMLNGPDSKWVGPSATQGTGNAEGDYVYRTTVDLTGYDLTRVQLVGGWAVDNSGTDILVNGASTGFTSGGFGALSSFTITNGLVAGKNTLDFKVNNLPATPNPTALRVDLQAILANAVATPRLRVTQSGSNLSISWTPATAGLRLTGESQPRPGQLGELAQRGHQPHRRAGQRPGKILPAV